MILIDSSVWIEFLKRPKGDVGRALDALLEEDAAGIVGVVLAEVLQGARNGEDFARLLRGLDAATYVPIEEAAWIEVGRLAMAMKLQGTPATLTDLAIAATALTEHHELFTLDTDFQRIPNLRLYNWEDPNA